MLTAAAAFLYAAVLWRLVQVWWTDENYSHGLLLPFVIAFLLWVEFPRWARVEFRAAVGLGVGLIAVALLFLFVGTLGAELFTQRVSLVILLAGIAFYLGGRRVWKLLLMPLALILLAIPIPEIVLNKITFPMQLLATDWAVGLIRVLAVPVLKAGNVIEVLPKGATATVQFEVVEACSGIRSLMTLATLALIYAFFTRRNDDYERLSVWRNSDFWRAVVLIAMSLPIAVATNAGRLMFVVWLAFDYGEAVANGFWHKFSGWLIYLAALILLFTTALIFDAALRLWRGKPNAALPRLNGAAANRPNLRAAQVSLLAAVLIGAAVFINWRETTGERAVPVRPLNGLPANLGEWQQRGVDRKFDEASESVLRTDDYLLRDYSTKQGRTMNLYVGFYASQRAGATYHSPRNCLPGAGWLMTPGELVEIKLANGRTFVANRYLIENKGQKFLMLYWYQGRGRFAADEYTDKLMTVWDSATRQRSDGALVRIMTPLAEDSETETLAAAVEFSGEMETSLLNVLPQ